MWVPDNYGSPIKICGDSSQSRQCMNIMWGNAYFKCTICSNYLHFMTSRGQSSVLTCFYYYHNDALFGLAQLYSHVVNVQNMTGNTLHYRKQ